MASYKIKELFYTLQGEGAQAGKPAIFCRFTGCNLWSGREEDRSKAVCQFCDTDFIGTDGENGGKYSAQELAQKALSLWPNNDTKNRFIVCTGGEPLLQLDKPLIDAFHQHGFKIAIETNGTILAPEGIDWICVSPKSNAEVIQTTGHELKLVYPQHDAMPQQFEHLKFEHFYLQPMDGDQAIQNTQATIQYCLQNPQWNMSVQTHKMLGIP